MGIVDVFDALTTARPYKDALSDETAYEELMLESDRGWRDRELVRTLMHLGNSNRLHARDTGGSTTRRSRELE